MINWLSIQCFVYCHLSSASLLICTYTLTRSSLLPCCCAVLHMCLTFFLTCSGTFPTVGPVSQAFRRFGWFEYVILVGFKLWHYASLSSLFNTTTLVILLNAYLYLPYYILKFTKFVDIFARSLFYRLSNLIH